MIQLMIIVTVPKTHEETTYYNGSSQRKDWTGFSIFMEVGGQERRLGRRGGEGGQRFKSGGERGKGRSWKL